MLLLMFALFFLLIKPTYIFAAPTVSIVDFPENIIAGEVFKVTFSVSDNIVNSYHYKVVGDGNNEVVTQPNTSCASSYENCENINIATDSANIATASAKLNLVSGTYKIKIRIAQSDKHTSTSNSDIVSINSVLPSPTPTIEPTSTPTLTPTKTPSSTPTPKITSTPTIKTTPTSTSTPRVTITPTSDLTPTPTNNEIIEPSPTSEPSVLGDVSTSNNNPKKNYLGIIFISLGGLLLLSPLFINKLQQCKKNSSKK